MHVYYVVWRASSFTREEGSGVMPIRVLHVLLQPNQIVPRHFKYGGAIPNAQADQSCVRSSCSIICWGCPQHAFWPTSCQIFTSAVLRTARRRKCCTSTEQLARLGRTPDPSSLVKRWPARLAYYVSIHFKLLVWRLHQGLVDPKGERAYNCRSSVYLAKFKPDYSMHMLSLIKLLIEFTNITQQILHL